MRIKLNSTQVVVEVEVRVELGNNSIQYETIQYNTNMVQYNALQCSVLQYDEYRTKKIH